MWPCSTASCYSLYETADGRTLAAGALEPKFWRNLCEVLGFPEFIGDQFAGDPQRTRIKDAVRARFRTRTAAAWLDSFAGADACVTLVRTLEETLADQELRRRETIVEISAAAHIGVTPKLEDTPGALGGPPPALGEHTREVLAAAGFTGDELEALC
jgi:crotonobetainyl-CoA:carnitine CoA-transferase CaiB-like acyl-CoA transferase